LQRGFCHTGWNSRTQGARQCV